MSKCGAISAGFDVVFQTISTPNVTNARNNGPTKTIVKNCEPVKVVFVLARSSTISAFASSSCSSKLLSLVSALHYHPLSSILNAT